MKILPDWLKNGYLRLMEPLADYLVRRRIHPNTITIVGTVFMVAGGVLYGTGHIMTGGWLLGITALSDVLDGMVARKGNKASVFGAFLDSTLDRVSDGIVLSGLAVFYALNPQHRNVAMVVVCLAAVIGSFVTSYTRARAESLGLDAKVGVLQREERVVLLSGPQALFGLTLNGWVLATIVIVLALTSWITVVQRVLYVYSRTTGAQKQGAADAEPVSYTLWDRPSRRETSARAALRGE